MSRKITDKYKYCNHYHEIDDEHEIVDFGDGEFVANKEAIPLLKALNEIGLRTRTHHIGKEEGAFISILLDKRVDTLIRTINEKDSTRTKYNGQKELLISWNKGNKIPNPESKKVLSRDDIEKIAIELTEYIVIDYANFSGRESAYRGEFRRKTYQRIYNTLTKLLFD